MCRSGYYTHGDLHRSGMKKKLQVSCSVLRNWFADAHLLCVGAGSEARRNVDKGSAGTGMGAEHKCLKMHYSNRTYITSTFHTLNRSLVGCGQISDVERTVLYDNGQRL